MSIGNELDTDLQDDEAVEEFRLVTELMVAASLARGDLEQAAVDSALGLATGSGALPQQRPSA